MLNPQTVESARSRPIDVLGLSAAAWLLAMILGQWAFFYYLAAFYGSSVVTGDLEVWNRLIAFGRTPYVAGDSVGNFTFASHALAAGIIALAGALQLLPAVRNRFPVFHRWNGRLFLMTVLGLVLSGFYLVWIRGPAPTRLEEMATSLNGLLILACGAAAFVAVRRRKSSVHRKWALRLYLLSNGQWFVRVGFFAYFVLAKALGHGPGTVDAFFQFWKFGSFLVPLAVLELYFFAQASGRRPVKVAVSMLVIACTLVMTLGMIVFGEFSQKMISGA
ncbi:MAG: hypothetical protein A3E01_07620 [Gammaproteobacteria bacterium RIFCSPHIGHO2_12_FULL_63_22]|nr:MAG: hypothetical protein A3E01_07620 [Gammaproteobacteria bacterium RIFCSPHIGHO2_12_FULL_63_22]